MNRLFILLLIVFISSCKNDTVNYALISGKVDNSTATEVVIDNGDFEQAIPIESDGTFADTLRLSESGFYTFKIGRERTTAYLKNGYDLNLTLDANQFDETIAFTGIGSSENNYLAAKQLNIEKLMGNSQEFYSLDEMAFTTRVDSIKTTNASLLEKQTESESDFKTIETQNLVYDSYMLFNNYERNHGYYTQNEDFKVADNFLPEGLKNLNYNDANAYSMSSSYQRMVFGKTMNDLFEIFGEDYLYASTEQLKSIETIGIPELKNDVVEYLGNFIVSPGNPNMESVYEFFLANTTREKIKTKLHEVFENGKYLMKGNPSPQFTSYENHKGGTVSLSDLKGKYVYIDVWATWCGPCKREIPALKEVEQQFRGKNIEFVSTSIDVAKDHDKWVAMVNDMSLPGLQLFADSDWNSQFVKDYGIKGIPRYILVDPEGNIFSADAPRPSNPRLLDILNSLEI